MGTILTSYGDAAFGHEGYAAQVLDDGTLTGTYSCETRPRMVGQVVAACGCGWTGSTRYPTTTGPSDETAEKLALTEWALQHAVPTLEAGRAGAWEELRALVRALAESHATTTRTRFSALTGAQQRALLDRTLPELDRAVELARRLREPWDSSGGDAR